MSQFLLDAYWFGAIIGAAFFLVNKKGDYAYLFAGSLLWPIALPLYLIGSAVNNKQRRVK